MSHKNNCFMFFFPYSHQFLLQLMSRQHIQSSEWFIHQK